MSLSFAGVKACGINLQIPKALCARSSVRTYGNLSHCVPGTLAGQITLAGEQITEALNEIARRGVARMFQNLLLFEHMTVLDNLMLGRHQHYQTSV